MFRLFDKKFIEYTFKDQIFYGVVRMKGVPIKKEPGGQAPRSVCRQRPALSPKKGYTYPVKYGIVSFLKDNVAEFPAHFILLIFSLRGKARTQGAFFRARSQVDTTY